MPQTLSERPADEEAELLLVRRELREAHEALAAATERERALAFEVQHRVRNMLSVIRAIFRRTRESGAEPEEFADHFEGRLNAVARHQTYVDATGTGGADLEDMLRDELLDVHGLDAPGCTLAGPPVALRGKAAELMGLAIHELATNSIKFGALAQGGSLDIGWTVAEAATGAVLHFRWTEGGVAVAGPAPRPSGFGQQLIEEALPYQLGATTRFDLRPGGIECRVDLPLAQEPSDAALLP